MDAKLRNCLNIFDNDRLLQICIGEQHVEHYTLFPKHKELKIEWIEKKSYRCTSL